MELVLGLVVLAVIVTALGAAWREVGKAGGSGTSRSDGRPPRPTSRESPDEAFITGYVVGRHLQQNAADRARQEPEARFDYVDDSAADGDPWLDGDFDSDE